MKDFNINVVSEAATEKSFFMCIKVLRIEVNVQN